MGERSGGLRLAVPLIVIVAVVVAAGVWWLRDSSEVSGPEPVEVAASGPRFADVAGLVGASDLVVVGTVVEIDNGRAITDPNDPTAGIRTQLASIDVTTVLLGDQHGPLVVEQEAILLDGTPLEVNGVAALVPGDEGLMFLTIGDSDEFPYAAFVNEQGWVPIVDGIIEPTHADDPVWGPLAGKRYVADEFTIDEEKP